MVDITKHPIKCIEVSIKRFEEDGITKYKVTKRVPQMSVAETKIFNTKEEATRQSDEWLRD
jgi:hypothetical protein